MIASDTLLKRLRSVFDLNIYEAKVWVSLLSKGVATAGELSDMSNVPRSRSYDVLESLEKRGFVVMKLGRPIKYLAIAPEEVLSRVKRDIEQRAKRDVTSLDRIEKEEFYAELGALFTQGIKQVDPGQIAGFLKNRSSAYDHLSSLMNSAKKQVIISTSDEGLVRKMTALHIALRKLRQNGVPVEIAAPLKSKEAKDVAQDLAKYATLYPKDFKSRFAIIDGKDLLFMVNSDAEISEHEDVAVWTNTPCFASAMHKMFDALKRE